MNARIIMPLVLTAVALFSIKVSAADADADRFPASSLPGWWKLGVEIRGRAEGHESFSGIDGQDDAYYLHRVRVASTFAVRSWLHVFAQAQDSRAPGYDRSP